MHTHKVKVLKFMTYMEKYYNSILCLSYYPSKMPNATYLLPILQMPTQVLKDYATRSLPRGGPKKLAFRATHPPTHLPTYSQA